MAAPRLLSVKNAMERLNIGRSTVFAELASGRLRSVKVGRRRLVPESAIAEFIEALEAAEGRT